MDNSIGVNDTVMVVKPSRCPVEPHMMMGYVFTVKQMDLNRNIPNNECMACGEKHYSDNEVMVIDEIHLYSFPLYRLKKIPPIEELNKIIQEEELKA